MPIESFPPLERADEHGILAVGGDLHPESLILAYKNGIFPWPLPDFPEIVWFAPLERAVCFVHEAHFPARDIRYRNRLKPEFRINSNFEAVIHHCQQRPRPGQGKESWITDEMKEAYIELHRLGMAHSFECYLEGNLAGGLYGVSLGGFFAAESMFYLRTNASKFALMFFIASLQHAGIRWFDIQQLTPHLERFGARSIPRKEFMSMLQTALAEPAPSFFTARP